MEIGYIGSGPISNFHIPALQNNGLIIRAVGTKRIQRDVGDSKKMN